MSWSTYTCGLPADIAGRIDALEPPGLGTAAREDQVKAAKTVAKDIIASGAVGTDVPFMVTLSGHANPGHMATAGSASDVLTTTVAQTTAAAVQQYDAQQKQALANE